MEYRVSEGKNPAIIIRCARGEELIAAIKKVCEETHTYLGTITGIGAVDHAKVGVFLVGEQRYESLELKEEMELCSLVGNISSGLEDTPENPQVYLHLHATFAKVGGSVVGGHLNSAVISGTGEIVIIPLEGRVGRRFDEGVGLNLLDFS